MVVYRAFFKVIAKNIPQLMIYIVVFVSIAATLANTNVKPVDANFAATKVNMVFINHDTDARLVEGLRDYLAKHANLVDIPDDRQKLQDALFFREVEYVVRVPDGFTEGLFRGNKLQLEKIAVPDASSAIYMDGRINKYIDTAKVYMDHMNPISEEQLIGFIEKDLALTTEVKLNRSAGEMTKNERRAFYFNYMAYALLSVLILGVSSVMTVFNHVDLKKRNLSSPIKMRSMNFQLILGNLSFAILTWMVMIFTSFIMYGSYMFTLAGLLFLLNSFVFTLAALSISYLVGNLVKSKNAMSAAANVISLGTCFISGVFVPQNLLGKTVLEMASFTPTYWYVKSNIMIGNLTSFSMESLAAIFLNMLIVIGFAVAVLAASLVLIKQRRMSQ